MPRHPRKRCPTTSTSTPTTQARKGDAEIPTDLDLFFLELDALFNAPHTNQQHIDSLHAQMVADMRNELARDDAVSVAGMDDDSQNSSEQRVVFASAVEAEDTAITITMATQQVQG
ncbi:hypothetical protein HDU77_001286, partial [Chytriomyces hyalinus]